MWKFTKDFFGLIGGCFRFLAELLQVLNSGLEEVNEGLDKFNRDLERKRLAQIKDNCPSEEILDQDAKDFPEKRLNLRGSVDD